jgi:hypothetical protein
LSGENGLWAALRRKIDGVVYAREGAESCEKTVENMFDELSRKKHCVTIKHMVKVVLQKDFFGMAVAGLQAAFDDTISTFKNELNERYVREVLVTIQSAKKGELCQAALDKKLEQLRALVVSGPQAKLQKRLDDIINMLSKSDFQDNVRGQIESMMQKDQSIIDKMEVDTACRREVLISLRCKAEACIKRMCNNFLAPSGTQSEVEGTAVVSSSSSLSSSKQNKNRMDLFVTYLRDTWVAQLVQKGMQGYKDQVGAQVAVHTKERLLKSLKGNLEVFIKDLETACDNLEKPQGLPIIGRLCANDFRKHRQREYFADRVQDTIHDYVVALPSVEASRCLAIDGRKSECLVAFHMMSSHVCLFALHVISGHVALLRTCVIM